MAEDGDVFHKKCCGCGGSGRVSNKEWAKWWKEHDDDWAEAMKAGNTPKEPELSKCYRCDGFGSQLTDLGKELVVAVANRLLFSKQFLKDFAQSVAEQSQEKQP